MRRAADQPNTAIMALVRNGYTILQAYGLIHRDAAVAAAIVVPNLLVLLPAVLVAGVEGAALAAVLRSAAFFAGRVRATAGEGFPLPDVLAQSAVVAGSAATVASGVDHATTLILGGILFATSLALAVLRRPAFVDRFVVSLVGAGLAGLRSGRPGRDWRS